MNHERSYDAVLWVALFLAMITGMIAKAIYDYIAKNQTILEVRLVPLLTRVALPMLVSPMIFGGVYGSLRDSPRDFRAFIFAFQNGFFWETVFGGLGASTEFLR